MTHPTSLPPKPRRRALRIVLGSLGAVTLAVGVWVVANWDFVFHRLGTVRDGVLYRSAQLSPGKLTHVIEEYGIRTIVNLCEEDPDPEQAVAERLGVQYIWLPSTQVPAQANIERFLALMDDPETHPVLVHCEHGVGRTGVLAGVYRKEYEGWDSERVLDEARWYAFWGSYWDGQDKTRYLEAYAPRESRLEEAIVGE